MKSDVTDNSLEAKLGGVKYWLSRLTSQKIIGDMEKDTGSNPVLTTIVTYSLAFLRMQLVRWRNEARLPSPIWLL